jgi:hypothetical protein
MRLEFCDGIESNYIGDQQSTPTPLIQFFTNDMKVVYKSYKDLNEVNTFHVNNN